MDKQIHIHLHFNDHIIHLGELIERDGADALPAAQVQAPPPAVNPAPVASSHADTREFFVTVYDSERQAFALGRKLYDSASGAERNRNNGSFSEVASFTLDLANRRVIGTAASGSSVRFWAVLRTDSGFELGRNSYTSEAALRGEYPELFAVLAGSEDDLGDVVLSGI
jgi:hypothetical protein